jgi:DHA3 family macrolide efflux protein-like MFS transporter
MRGFKPLTGMTAFIVIWIGQAISLIGTGMSGFAMTIWAYEKTGQATALALVGFFFMTPMLLLSPVAGAIVDRSNRKLMMIISDLASGVATIGIFILNANGRLEIWQLYVAVFVMGTFQTFQWPAYSAAITMMIDRKQYARAAGLNQLAESGSGIIAPILAGALLGFIGLQGILTIDIITFLFAIGGVMLAFIPQPKVSREGEEGRGSLWTESLYGFKYIFKRISLLGLQLVFMAGNFFAVIAITLIAPMILAHTSNNELALGTVQSIAAMGAVTGALLMGAWGGPKRLVHGVLLGWVGSSLFGMLLVGLGQAIPIWALGGFIGALFGPIINGSNQAIWQMKVAPDVQGRVFSVRRLIAWFVNPVATLIAGPLADVVMEPAMQSGGSLAKLLGPIFGTGPGSGMSVIIAACGVGGILVGLSGYAFRAIRDVQILLPDFDTTPAGEPVPEEQPQPSQPLPAD